MVGIALLHNTTVATAMIGTVLMDWCSGLTSSALRISSRLLYRTRNFRLPLPGANRTFLITPLLVVCVLQLFKGMHSSHTQ